MVDTGTPLASGSSSARPKLSKRPEYIKKLNDSVYELKRPLFDTPDIDVIFFHGLQHSDYEEAFWLTWVSRNVTDVWPREWLGENLPLARILSVSYDYKRGDPYLIVENLISNIIEGQTCGAGQDRPVVLVGHCLGCIIIMKMIVYCFEAKNRMPDRDRRKPRLEAFLKNLKGVFFYAPPHGGGDVEYLSPLAGGNKDMLGLLKVLSPETARINQDFDMLKESEKISVQRMSEGLETPVDRSWLRSWLPARSVKVVEEAGARGLGERRLFTVKANHIDVCRPANKTDDDIFTKLFEYIVEIVPGVKTEDIDNT